MHMWRVFCFVAALHSTGAMAAGTVLEVNPSPYKQWCIDQTFVDLGQLETAKGQTEAYARAEAAFVALAKKNAIESLGLPFAEKYSLNATGQLAVTICAIVPPSTDSAEDPIRLERVVDAKFLGAICNSEAIQQCDDNIRAKLSAEPWNMQAETIDALQWRQLPVGEIQETPEAIALSVTNPQGVTINPGAPVALLPSTLAVVVVRLP